MPEIDYCVSCGLPVLSTDEVCHCPGAASSIPSTSLLAILEDDELAQRVAGNCNDPAHDPRWCQTCEARTDGIESYRHEIMQLIANATGQGRR